MQKYEIDKSILDFLLGQYTPTVDCIEAKGECDYRDTWSDDKCPCAKILELKRKLDGSAMTDTEETK